MKKLLIPICLVLLCVMAGAAPRQEWFRNLSLEETTLRSDLILAAQVIDVSEIKLLRGGKGESSHFQYKFKPIRVLKGVFARGELSLGSADLGLHRAEEMKGVKPGALMLIFLGRSDAGYTNDNRPDSGNMDQSMPPLFDAKDPLLDAVELLLAMGAEPDRIKRASLLAGGLNKASGAGAVALMDSLKRRALPAAQNPDVAGALARHLIAPSPAVRESAAHAMRTVLEADYLEHAPLRELAVAKCVEALALKDTNTFARAAMIRALGRAGSAASKTKGAMDLLSPKVGDAPINTMERAAQFRAIGDLISPLPEADFLSALSQLPIDDNREYSHAAEYAMARIQPGKAVVFLNARLDQKLAAGFDGRVEIAALAHLPPEHAAPALIRISKLQLNRDEKAQLAESCLKLVEEKPDPQLVEPLAGLLSPDEPSRDDAVSALLKIGTESAAKVLLPRLREEQNLLRKLRIAEMLGRHGIKDGYVFAIEHLSEVWLREQAVAALAAIKEPDAIVQLKAILKTSNDVGWNIASVRGLGAMGARDMAPQFLKFVDDLRNPLAPAALIALADLGEIKALDKASEGLSSRNNEVVNASARAAARLLAIPGVADKGLRGQLDALLADADADQASRAAALDALVALKYPQLDRALAQIVRESALENTDLMQRSETLMRLRKVKL